MTKYTIAQISDLHIGEAGYRNDKIAAGIEEINKLEPDFTVVAGDLTWSGVREQFREAQELLKDLKGPQMVIMGNHDASNVGYLTFEEIFGLRLCQHQDERVFILGVDSSQPDLDTGHIGREHRRFIDRTFTKVKEGLVKIFALHHHLVPVPRSGRERDILVDAGDILELMMHKGVSLVLSGHRHYPWVWRLENMLLVYSGTSGSPRLRGSPTQNYNILTIDNRTITISTKYIGGPSRVRGRYRLSKKGVFSRLTMK